MPTFKSPCLFVLPLLLAAVFSWARDMQQPWVQVSSRHFTIICQGNEKQARRIGDQLERMRLVFKTTFPNLQVDPSAPVVVIVVKDQKAFRALEPDDYLVKGGLELTGSFLRAPEKNYVLLRLDAGGNHPYATVYHEYTHLLTSKAEFIPLWLNEGLAEFYENTEVSGTEAVLGQADEGQILWLRQNPLLPLLTLFTVDHNSPYYHQENKGSMFYAESWALTHYLQIKGAKENKNYIRDYLLLVANQVDPVTAAGQAFGDLKHLQSALQTYIAQPSFDAFKLNKPLALDDASFSTQPISTVQADAYRADLLAYVQREKDARTLLEQILRDDPNNTLAHETMGYLEFRAGHLEQAQNWYEQAVKLDSQSYLAQYYYASMALSSGRPSAQLDRQIEDSLLKAIKLNPAFAGSYAQLAVFYAMRHKTLSQAHMLSLQAIQLEPANVHFRVYGARVLLEMERGSDALPVLQAALKLAKTPEEVSAVQNEMQALQYALSVMEHNRKQARDFREEMEAAKRDPAAEPHLRRQPSADGGTPEVETAQDQSEDSLTGPHHSASGIVRNVRCSPPAVIDADLVTGSKTITLHTRNFYTIQFSALGYTPAGDFQPCTELEGRQVKIEYIESATNKLNGLVAVELHK